MNKIQHSIQVVLSFLLSAVVALWWLSTTAFIQTSTETQEVHAERWLREKTSNEKHGSDGINNHEHALLEGKHPKQAGAVLKGGSTF